MNDTHDLFDSEALVLIVDDAPLLRLAAEALVGAVCQAKPHVAEDGCESVAKVLSVDYDFILMDLRMPVLDGTAAVKLIRLVEATVRPGRRAPIVAYTGDAENVDRSALIAAGFDDLLAKPASREQMAACMRRWCRRRTGLDGEQSARVDAILASLGEATSMSVVVSSLQELDGEEPSPTQLRQVRRDVHRIRLEIGSSVERSLARSVASIASSRAALARSG